MTGLRGYQGEFTFSGLEEHLFSELRRFRTGKDDLLERDLVKLSSSLSLRGWTIDPVHSVVNYLGHYERTRISAILTEPRSFEFRHHEVGQLTLYTLL